MTAPRPNRGRPLHALIALYPRAWRERYGAEFGTLLDESPAGLGLIINVIFGAVDARVRPQAIVGFAMRPSAANAEGAETMSNTLTRFKCPGYGSEVTRRDQWVGAGVMLGGTLVLALAWMALHAWVGDNPYVDAFSALPFLVPLLLSLPFTYLKGRPRVSQIVFLGGSLLLLLAIGALAGFVTARI